MFRQMSIRHKIQGLALVIILTCTVSFTVYHAISERTAILRSIDDRLYTAAYAIPQILPEDYHGRAVNAQSISPEERQQVLKAMSDFARQAGLKYIYSLMNVDGNIVFTSCSATPEELEKGTYTQYFDGYSSASEGVKRAFTSQTVQFLQEADEFGDFRSVLIPLQTDSGKTYVVGSDIPTQFVRERLRHLVVRSVILGLIFFGLFCAVSSFLAERIARPIEKLTLTTNEIIANQFNVIPGTMAALEQITHSSGNEIGALASSIQFLQEELQRYIADLMITTAAKEKIESELKIAHDIQMNLLPRAFPGAPSHPEVEMHAVLEPAREVGGDLFDWFEIGGGRIFFSVGDVSDKGVPAALFMAVTKALFRAYGQENLPLGEVVGIVNNELSRENDSQMFVTVFCGIIDLATGGIEYCDGGHENPLIAARDGSVRLVEKAGGTALGFLPDTPYISETIQLEPGDTFFLYTDGVNEAMDPHHKQFSVGRLQACLEEAAAFPPADLTRHVVDRVHRHAGTEPQSDDITVMAIRYLGRPAAA
ncbi:MAG: SpoIIE family protein phosphatase [bacterium]